MKKLLIVANWKMNKNRAEVNSFFEEFLPQVKTFKNEIVIAPSFTLLQAVNEKIKNTNIKLASQNMSCENEGAFTGEVNAKMLNDFETDFVILGHSERRQLFLETDEQVNQKVLKALENNLIPILCVGENLEQYENGLGEEVVNDQVLKAIKNVKEEDLNKLVIAYEPIWAIGTGKAMTATEAEKIAKFIKKIVQNSVKTAKNVKILYGGSVKPQNCNEYFEQENIDGALIGGASLDAHSFAKIILG